MRQLGVGEPGILAKLTLDIRANRPPRPRELTRDRGLVLLEQASGFGERQLLNIVTTKPQAIPAVEPSDGGAEGPLYQREVARAIGVRRRLAGLDAAARFRGTTRRLLLVRERLESPLRAQTIDVPLSEYGSQPRGETASPVEIPEQRSPLAVAFLHAIQVGVQSIGQVASATARIEGIGRAIEERPVLEDQALPGLLVSGGALARELEVGAVERGHSRYSGLNTVTGSIDIARLRAANQA